MSVRVVARLRPLLKKESEKDVIVFTASPRPEPPHTSSTIVRIPNPKNEAEMFSFQFNNVYEQDATQQDVFDNEVAPTVKHLFNGLDVTIFVYGVSGSGKTHTMRGGKSLADRGVIPRLLSSIYRRSRKVEKDSAGATKVEVAVSYYEIYKDSVYDLFEPPEKRTPAGLPIRDNNGKSVVVGLTERPCSTLKDFEQLYDQANVNRSTSATKLNAHSSRSHAILCVKLTQISADQTLISTASAIDLAGSEDNRRTGNNKDRLVESASINKSLFVLAQCVEAISKKQARIPYRESKMTRILSLGQNNGLTVMILNLAPVRSYHLDTLSSLNFANRTKRIEVNEVENEPIFTNAICSKPTISVGGPSLQRQPLRQLAQNVQMAPPTRRPDKPIKAFSVYSDKGRSGERVAPTSQVPNGASLKRSLDVSSSNTMMRPSKTMRPSGFGRAIEHGLSKVEIEEMIERRIDQKIAERALSEKVNPAEVLNSDLQKRLTSLEQRVAEKEDSEGLQYLLMAKQHQARGEDASALKMYQLAKPFFPHNEKLLNKINGLQEKITRKKEEVLQFQDNAMAVSTERTKRAYEDSRDKDYIDEADGEADGSFVYKTKARKNISKQKVSIFRDQASTNGPPTPRTQQLLSIINSRDLAKIKLLKGVGMKKAELIVNSLREDEDRLITDLEQLGSLKGVGWKTVENMRSGLSVL